MSDAARALDPEETRLQQEYEESHRAQRRAAGDEAVMARLKERVAELDNRLSSPDQ